MSLQKPYEALSAPVVLICFILALIITIILEKRQPQIFLEDGDIEDPIIPVWILYDPYEPQPTAEDLAMAF